MQKRFLNQNPIKHFSEIYFMFSKNWITKDLSFDMANDLISSIEVLDEEMEDFLFETNQEVKTETLKKISESERISGAVILKNCEELFLLWAKENIEKIENPEEFIQRIYSDLDYPETLKKYVSYMPVEGEPNYNFKDFIIREIKGLGT